ncbi:MAG: glycosyltransferase family 2 protein [Anaerolineales bacterium]|nr:glycosyltransferase family 2 protein [Anaerolineales bacterium]
MSVTDPASPSAAPAVEVSIVMPCLNEHETVGACVRKAREALAANQLAGEVIVADNGSTDGSIELAEQNGARVVHQTLRGYGAAYMKGVAHARGRYIVIGDSDDTYDFGDVPRLLERLRAGDDVVLGSRFMGQILPGAMPWANQHIGNPILTTMLNRLFHLKISDAHSGLRAFTRPAWDKMQLQTPGMEFASEMLIKAAFRRLRISEVPITYHPRMGDSKLNPLNDAWRHIRFMLLFSPTYLFMLPGALALTLGLVLTGALMAGPLQLGGLYIGVHYLVLGSLLSVLGLMMLSFGLSAKAFAFSENLLENERWIERFFEAFSLERGLAAGGLLALAGLVILVTILAQYLAGFQPERFNQLINLHQAIAASTLLMLGAQIMASSFFISLLEIHRQHAGR